MVKKNPVESDDSLYTSSGAFKIKTGPVAAIEGISPTTAECLGYQSQAHFACFNQIVPLPQLLLLVEQPNCAILITSNSKMH